MSLLRYIIIYSSCIPYTSYATKEELPNVLRMEQNQFGTFRSTYKLTSFLLCISMMYPHPKTIKRRFFGFLVTALTMSPLVTIILINTFNSLLNRDILYLTHHSTVVGPYFGGVVKVMISSYMSKEGHKILCEINRDYALYNTLPEHYQAIAKSWIKNSLYYCEKCWILIVTMSGVLYVTWASFLNIRSDLTDEAPKRFMIHDTMVPLTEPETRFETPLFEFIFGESMYAVSVVVVYYLGYDSFFALAVNHACLKIDIYCAAFEDALKIKNKAERHEKIVRVVHEQLRLFEYIETIQKYFNIYLGIVLFAALIQIGTCLYHITENDEFDLRYAMIAVCSIGAIYLPCCYASKLKFAAQESATRFYIAGWHNFYCVGTRRVVLFMIGRAQIPVIIMGFNFIIFDMELFLSILQSAYSIYTLMCS